MTLEMLDSITPANMPRGFDAYAGYVGGRFPTFGSLHRLFPGELLLSIAISASEDADALDVEAQDAFPGQIPGWVRPQHARGHARPCLYASVSVMPAVLAVLSNAGIPRPSVRLWSAHYTHQPHICGPDTCAFPGVPALDGTQWTDQAPGVGGTLIDESLLLGDFFATPAPAPPPKPVVHVLTTEDDMSTEFDSTQPSHGLLPPFGTTSMDLLTPAPDGSPVTVSVSWVGDGADAKEYVLAYGTAGTQAQIPVPESVKKGRLDIVSGGGIGSPVSVRWNQPAS